MSRKLDEIRRKEAKEREVWEAAKEADRIKRAEKERKKVAKEIDEIEDEKFEIDSKKIYDWLVKVTPPLVKEELTKQVPSLVEKECAKILPAMVEKECAKILPAMTEKHAVRTTREASAAPDFPYMGDEIPDDKFFVTWKWAAKGEKGDEYVSRNPHAVRQATGGVEPSLKAMFVNSDGDVKILKTNELEFFGYVRSARK